MLAMPHMVPHQSLPPFIWDLFASQSRHFQSFTEAKGPSGNIPGYRAVMTSMQDTSEVIEGALP